MIYYRNIIRISLLIIFNLIISNWPTIPQVYVNGEFIGGSDITLSLFRSGELQKMFEEAGIEMATETA